MFFEGLLLIAFGAAAAVAVVKIYQWRQDVLYGPYLERRRATKR